MSCRRFASALSLLLLPLPALAQERAQPTPHAEAVALEGALARVDAALADLEGLGEQHLPLVQYDVRRLLVTPLDQRRPRLRVPSDTSGYVDGGDPGCFVFEDCDECSYLLDPDQIEDMVVRGLGEDAWDDPASIQVQRGWLLVRQTPARQAQVREVLRQLSTSLDRTFSVEVGSYRLPPALAEELDGGSGVLDASQLARIDAAVDAGQAQLLQLSLLSAREHEWVSLRRTRQRAYVADYERSSGGTGEVIDTVTDPIVEVLESGLSMELRAAVVGDGLELELNQDRAREEPGRQQETPWGTVETPQLQSGETQVTVRVPFGGGALVQAAGEDAEQAPTWVIVRAQQLR